MALATNLVAYYKLDSSGADSVGSNTLTNTGCTFQAGKIGNGALYGTKLLSSTSPVTGSGAWSFSVWYNSSTTGTNKQILTLGDAAQGSKAIIYLYTSTGNAIQLDTSGAGLITSSNTSSLDGKWHHLVVTSAGNSFVMYIDGVQVGTGSTTGMNLGTNLLSLGYDNPNSRWSWVGMLDEVGFWSRQLSADEVLQIYNNNKGNAYPLTDTPSLYGASSYFQMEEGTGNVRDVGTNALTLTNTSTSFAAGKIGRSASFNGSSSKLVAGSNAITANQALTISAWVKSTTTTGAGCIVGQYTSIVAGVFWFNFVGGGFLNFTHFDGSSTFNATDNVNIADGNWHFVVCTVNAAHSSVKFSTDGSAFRTYGITTVTNWATHTTSVGWKNNDFYNGNIDEVGIWARELSAAEVTAMYNSGNGLTFPFNTIAPQIDQVTDVTATNTTTSKTFAHTCGTGSNRVLYVLAGCSTSTITGVTYNGVAMTRAVQVNLQSSWSELWYLVNPASGTNNVIITCAGSNSITGGAISYINAAQSGQPDATHADVSQTGSVTSYSQAITTVTDNDMVLLAGRANGGLTITPTTKDVSAIQPEVAAMGMFGTYGTIPVSPAQSNIHAITSSAQQFFGVMAAVKPYSAPTSNINSNFFVFM